MKPGLNWIDTLSPPARRALVDASGVRVMPDGVVLYQQGDVTTEFFQIEAGEVRQFLLTADGLEVLLYINRRGDVIADSSAVDREPYPTIIATRGATRLRVWRVETLDRLRRAYPELDGALAVQMAKRMRAFLVLIEELCTLPMPARVAGRLLAFADMRGAADLDISQADLALMAGVARASVNEILAELRARRLVETEYARIRILDSEGLRLYRDASRRRPAR